MLAVAALGQRDDRCGERHDRLRETEALDRVHEAADRGVSIPMMRDVDNIARAIKRTHRNLSGCAHPDCLEIAIPATDYCPLHNQAR
jgi:hypothetical protein